jgi:hypothetical protein
MTGDEVFDNDDAPEFDDSELFGDDEEFVLDESDVGDDDASLGNDSPAGAGDDYDDELVLLDESMSEDDEEELIVLGDSEFEDDDVAAQDVEADDDDEIFVLDESELEDAPAEDSATGDAPAEEVTAEELLEGGIDAVEELIVVAEKDFEEVIQAEQDEQDLLFGDGSGEVAENVLGESATFSEAGESAWGGEDTELTDLGVSMVDDEEDVPLHMTPDADDGMFDIDDDDDLILVDADGDVGMEIEDDPSIDFDEEAIFEGAEIPPTAVVSGAPTTEEIPALDSIELEESVDALVTDADDLGMDSEVDSLFETASADVGEPDFDSEFDTNFDKAFDNGFDSDLSAETLDEQSPIDAEFQEFAGGLGADLNVNVSEDFDNSLEVDEPAIDFEARDFDVSEEETDSEWAPVSEFDDGEEELFSEDEEEYDESGDEFDEEDQDFSEHEEAYYDQSHDFVEYAEARYSPFRWVASIAAALLIAAAASFWFMKTDDFTPDTSVDVIEMLTVPRPAPEVEVGEPSQKNASLIPKMTPIKKAPVATTPKKGPTTKAPVATAAKKGPTTKAPVATTAKKGPTTKAPVATAAKKGPATKAPVATTPKKADPVAKAPGAPKRVESKVGGIDGTGVSGKSEGLMDRHKRSVVEEVNGLVMGAQAVAQLNNENIFVGRVKALNSSFITLRTKGGEVTLMRSDLRVFTALIDTEFESWKALASTGLVKLHNSNRLKGKIVEARDDAVVLMVNANRVIIPRSAIESVTTQSKKVVNFDAQEAVESDDWFRQLVERKVEKADAEKPKTAGPGK